MIALFGIAVLCGVLGIVVDEIIRSWDSRTSEEAERRAREREEALKDVEATAMRNPPGFSASGGPCALVSGEAVVASDTFKTWVFGLKNIVGGESKNFTRLFDRARREALLREMFSQASRQRPVQADLTMKVMPIW